MKAREQLQRKLACMVNTEIMQMSKIRALHKHSKANRGAGTLDAGANSVQRWTLKPLASNAHSMQAYLC